MKKILYTLLFVLLAMAARAQEFSEFQDTSLNSITLGKGKNQIQIGGRVSGYYEYRALKPGFTNLDHNGFAMKDGDIDLLGHTKQQFVYEFHLSVLDLATAAATQNTDNPANPGIKAAYLEYMGWPVHIKFGYDKLPFSQGSLNEVWGTPMWSHANLYGGDLFSRRDMGITLNSSFWKNRINLYAGAYSGMGENFFEYGNDQSGTFEYVGRAEFCYPAVLKYQPIDEDHNTIPQIRLAVDARYEDKTQPAGQTIASNYPDALGAYGTRMINGKRLIYGGDFIIKYQGFSALFEADIMRLQPTSATDDLYQGTPASFNGGYINSGGFVTGLNYDWQKIRSVFSIQYENFNTNDLQKGAQSWLYLGYAYKVKGFKSVFKVEYFIPTTEDVAANPLKYTSELRVGYQIVF